MMLSFGECGNPRALNKGQAARLQKAMELQGIWRDDSRSVIQIPFDGSLVAKSKMGKKETKLEDLPYLYDVLKVNKRMPKKITPFSGQHRYAALLDLRKKLEEDQAKFAGEVLDLEAKIEGLTLRAEEMKQMTPAPSEVAKVTEVFEEIVLILGAKEAELKNVKAALSHAKALHEEGTDWVVEVYDSSECSLIIIIHFLVLPV